ncbi:MAG TPA: NFACT family protein, partial [Ardenticatenaceae bacterium]|nr:NFACT family protein [Ardenticatenaceae bacterium]
MHVDFLTLACLRDELDAFVDGRVQQVVLPDDLSVGLELYARGAGRRFLLLSAHPQYARALLSDEKLRRGVEKETPLLLLLRKYVRGARLAGLFQPPWERVLDLRFESAEGASRLLVELMGRHSNVVLAGADGRVLEAIKRVGPEVNRYRVTLPGKPYVPPPPQANKLVPTSLDRSGWQALLDGADPEGPLAPLLLQKLAGTSPTLAREMAARAAGDPDGTVADATPERLIAAVAELFAPLESGAWAPSVALDDEERVVAFAPYELTHLAAEDARVETVASIGEAVARAFEARLTGDAYAAARRRVASLLDEARGRIAAARHQLERQSVAPEELDRLREAGELLLAYGWQAPARARELVVPDAEGQPRTIALDPALSPVENAQAYFRRYEKAKRAAEAVPVRQDEVEAQLAYLEQLASDLALAESRPEIVGLTADLAKYTDLHVFAKA